MLMKVLIIPEYVPRIPVNPVVYRQDEGIKLAQTTLQIACKRDKIITNLNFGDKKNKCENNFGAASTSSRIAFHINDQKIKIMKVNRDIKKRVWGTIVRTKSTNTLQYESVKPVPNNNIGPHHPPSLALARPGPAGWGGGREYSQSQISQRTGNINSDSVLFSQSPTDNLATTSPIVPCRM